MIINLSLIKTLELYTKSNLSIEEIILLFTIVEGDVAMYNKLLEDKIRGSTVDKLKQDGYIVGYKKSTKLPVCSGKVIGVFKDYIEKAKKEETIVNKTNTITRKEIDNITTIATAIHNVYPRFRKGNTVIKTALSDLTMRLNTFFILYPHYKEYPVDSFINATKKYLNGKVSGGIADTYIKTVNNFVYDNDKKESILAGLLEKDNSKPTVTPYGQTML